MSPNPLSLLCALLLTLPLAIVFTINTPSTAVITGDVDTPVIIPTLHPTTTTNCSLDTPPLTLLPPPQIQPNQTTSILPSPPPPPPPPTPPPPPPDTEVYEDKYNDLLFQLASRVNPDPTPSGAPRKLAFMFLTTAPLPLAPLWELYFNGTPSYLYNIYIHADPNSKYDPPFTGVFANRIIPSKPTRRHSPTLIAAHRRLLAHALVHDPSNYMFALVSASCIPLHSFHFTYQTVINSSKSFIEILKNEESAQGRWSARGDDVMLPEVPLESFRIGSQFSMLTRRHAKIVVSDTRLWSKFKLPCLEENLKRCYPEENYFPTLVSMVDPRGSVPATLTHVNWVGHYDGHPHTYTAMDVGPELIRNLRRGRLRYGDDGNNGSDASVTGRDYPLLFARKFEADTVGALLGIANDVILKENYSTTTTY